MDSASLTAAFDTLETLYDSIQALRDLQEPSAIELQRGAMLDLVNSAKSRLFEGQTEYSTVISRVRDLEAKLVAADQWAQEKVHYELHELAAGTVTYRIKRTAQGGGPVHDLCTCCYEQGIKSILQFSGVDQRSHETFTCPRCKWVYIGKKVNSGGFIDINF